MSAIKAGQGAFQTDEMDSTNSHNPTAPDAQRLAEARRFVLEVCGPALADFGIDPESVPADFDLRANGIIDSLGFVELVVELEDKHGIELDLEALDPEQITVLGPLAAHVADRLQARSEGAG